MSKPPPENLMEWSKADLAREVQRLRAVNHEFSSRDHDDARSGGQMLGGRDPYARGGVLLDTRGAVLMDEMDVCLVDAMREDEPPAMMMLLGGRVNYEQRRVYQGYLFGPDGAAGLVTQLIGLAQRAGNEFTVEFKALLEQRMAELP